MLIASRPLSRMISTAAVTIWSASSSSSLGTATPLSASRDGQRDLADMLTGPHHRKRLIELLPVEDVADLRPDAGRGNHLAHLAVCAHTAHRDPDDAQVIQHHLGDRDGRHVESA